MQLISKLALKLMILKSLCYIVIWDTTCLQKMQAGCLSKWKSPWIRNLHSLVRTEELKAAKDLHECHCTLPSHLPEALPVAVPWATPGGRLRRESRVRLKHHPAVQATKGSRVVPLWRRLLKARGSRIKRGSLRLLLMCAHWHRLLRTIKPTRPPPWLVGLQMLTQQGSGTPGSGWSPGKRLFFIVLPNPLFSKAWSVAPLLSFPALQYFLDQDQC